MAFSLTQTPAFQEPTPGLIAAASPEELDRYYRIACVAHLLMDMGRAIASDIEAPENQQPAAFSDGAFTALALDTLAALDAVARTLVVQDISPILANCRSTGIPNSPTVN